MRTNQLFKRLSLLIMFFLFISGACIVTATPAYAKTYKIKTATDWKNISKANGGTFKLMKDIRLTDTKQYLTISKNKKYIIDLNGHKVVTTYSGTELRAVSPLYITKGTVVLKSSKKNKGVLYSTESSAVTISGNAKFYLKSGAIVNDAVEFRSDTVNGICTADNSKCYISGNSSVMSIGSGIIVLGKAQLYLTGQPFIRAGANDNAGMFTHYGNGIAILDSGCKVSLKGGSIGTKATPDTVSYGPTGEAYIYAGSGNYPVIDISGKVLGTTTGYKYIDAKGTAVPVLPSNVAMMYPSMAAGIGEKKLEVWNTDPQGYYTVYILKG